MNVDDVELLIVKDQSAEAGDPPEFRYLVSCLVNQARRVFGSIAVRVRRDGEPLRAVPRATTVLLLGRADVLCSERSLRRLRDALGAGADVAAPRPLTGARLDEHPRPRGAESPRSREAADAPGHEILVPGAMVVAQAGLELDHAAKVSRHPGDCSGERAGRIGVVNRDGVRYTRRPWSPCSRSASGAGSRTTARPSSRPSATR